MSSFVEILSDFFLQLVQPTGRHPLAAAHVGLDESCPNIGHGSGEGRKTGPGALLGWVGSNASDRGARRTATRSLLPNDRSKSQYYLKNFNITAN